MLRFTGMKFFDQRAMENVALKLEMQSWVRRWADRLGVPLAYRNAQNSALAEVILAFGLLPEREQRRLAEELKVRVSPPAVKASPPSAGHRPRDARAEPIRPQIASRAVPMPDRGGSAPETALGPSALRSGGSAQVLRLFSIRESQKALRESEKLHA
jgi:hypothetical protein